MEKLILKHGTVTEVFDVTEDQMKDIKECLEGKKSYVVLERNEQEVILPSNYLKNCMITVNSEAKIFFF